jgi:hypothetical protein
MLHKKSIIGSMLVCAVVFLMSGCYKDKTVIFDTPADEITRTVTFAADIIPIFNTSCAVSGCHSAGGKAPDLTSDKAFNALAIGGYVNAGDPESSVIYQWLIGKKSTQMPVGGINKDYNALILAWIKQGAQNN